MTLPAEPHHDRDPHASPAPSSGADLGFDLPPPAQVGRPLGFALGAGAVVLLATAFAIGWLPRRHARAELEGATAAATKDELRLTVVTPKLVASDRALVLPGSVQPLEETVIHPRASGYVKKWLADIGDEVNEGQLLAEIDTPELDQQLAAARAGLAQAEAGLVQSKANHALSKANLERYEALTPSGVTSQAELDEKQAQSVVGQANVTVAQANVEAQRANVRRFAEMKSFARVVAPFAGRIVARMIERGALVSPETPAFRLSSTDPVRVFVQVPQDAAPSVQAGLSARVTVREYPGRTFDGQVTRSAGALDTATRTMNTEVRVPNPKGELLAGMYAEVALTLPAPHRAYEVPATALLNDANGLRVATVDQGGKVHLVPVTIERDTGSTIQIASGLSGSERVARIASPELVEGRAVEVIP